MSKKNGRNWLVGGTIGTVIVTAVLAMLLFRAYVGQLQNDSEEEEYSGYYVMIVDDRKSDLWKEIYKSAYHTGQEQDIYVELFGDNLLQNYSNLELLQIATYSGVDGIIIEADESEEMSALINQAVEAGIPVVTVNTDNTQSERCSYVGKGNYDIGREYGRLVLDIAYRENKSQDVLMLVGMSDRETSKNLVWTGLQETVRMANKNKRLTFNLSMEPIDDSSTFKVEESIRDLFMREDVPDIIICLNETNTACVYQAVVDYNKVGEVNILGYYASETVLKGIDRNVIEAAVTVNTEQMGRYCVEALTEYRTMGNTSDYFAVDIAVVNKENASVYMGGEEDAEK